MYSLQATPESHWLPLRSTRTLAMASDLLSGFGSDKLRYAWYKSMGKSRGKSRDKSWDKSWGNSWGESWGDSWDEKSGESWGKLWGEFWQKSRSESWGKSGDKSWYVWWYVSQGKSDGGEWYELWGEFIGDTWQTEWYVWWYDSPYESPVFESWCESYYHSPRGSGFSLVISYKKPVILTQARLCEIYHNILAILIGLYLNLNRNPHLFFKVFKGFVVSE